MTTHEVLAGYTGSFPTLQDIREAHERIRPFVHRTPVMRSSSLDRLAGCSLYFKCENLQRVGAFKFRGASNAVFSLTPRQAERGVATHSSGNHAAALALAARERGIPAHIVMPENAPDIKKRAVEGYGGRITYCAATLAAREETLATVVERTGAAFVHPYDDDRIIAGQATAAVELIEETGRLDTVMTPVGGGGLLSGTALAVHYLTPGANTVAAEPEGADDAALSFRGGRLVPSVEPNTIADGLLTSLSDRTFAIILRNVQDIVTVSDQEIIAAMRLVWERMNIVIEASAAVPLAAVLSGRMQVREQRIGIILSGGNLDLTHLPWQE